VYALTGASGNPKAKQWFDAAPLTAQQIKQSTDGGIFHGGGIFESLQEFRENVRTHAPAERRDAQWQADA
jgi:hypothetical protein